MDIALRARRAANALKVASNDSRTAALKAIHDRLRDHKDEVLRANRLDVEAAQSSELSSALIKRLELTSAKYDVMLQGVLDVAALEDPMNKISMDRQLDDGLELCRVSSPVGVLLVIFEARPEVIAQVGSLAIKSGNAAILKGGKESLNTFTVIQTLVRDALGRTPVPSDALQLIATREAVSELLQCDELIDMVIPRGSNELVRSIKRSTTIPVLGHADGICSVYVDAEADAEMAARICVDAKTNYAAACNAVERVLVHSAAFAVTQRVVRALLAHEVTVLVEQDMLSALESSGVRDPVLLKLSTSAQDFQTEFLSHTLALKQVDSAQAAIDFINSTGSHHTDAIVTDNETTATHFVRAVDSAGVYWNASTRFADGYRYGFGAEVGVSTNKLHARGPVGLEGLMSYQYILKGSGQVAGDYVGAGGSRHFNVRDR